MLHAARCLLHVAFCTFHAARCMLPVACSMLRVACCTLHAARCMLHAARCMLHAARCMLHVACCLSLASTLHASTASCVSHKWSGDLLPNVLIGFRVLLVEQLARIMQQCRCHSRTSRALGRREAAANLHRSVRMCERMRAGLDNPATPASTHAHHRLPRGDTDLSERASLLWSSWQGRAQEYLAKVSSSESAPGAHEPILKMDTASSVTSCTNQTHTAWRVRACTVIRIGKHIAASHAAAGAAVAAPHRYRSETSQSIMHSYPVGSTKG